MNAVALSFSFREVKRIRVRNELREPVENLNELEYVEGEIHANVWRSDRVARISPATGKVVGWIDLAGLVDKRDLADPDAVLNGIAHDTRGHRVFVTEKLWPKLFEIKVQP